MKDRLDSYYLKAAEFDVDNIKQMKEYNQKEWASKIEQIDKMMALAQSQAMVMQPLTEQEKAQAFILGWQGAWQGTFAVEQIGKITQNSLAKKQALNEAVQAKKR